MTEEKQQYVIFRKKDYLNLRTLGRRFPLIGDVLKTVHWLDCTDRQGEVWNGLTPQEWYPVDTLIRAYPKILKAAQDLEIDLQMADSRSPEDV